MLVLAGLAPAGAQTLSIDGVWGNEPGCAFAKAGHGDRDDYMFLSAEGLQTYGTGCEWTSVMTARGGEQVATGLCGYEGEEGLGVESYIIVADGGVTRIHASNGELWGEVSRCP